MDFQLFHHPFWPLLIFGFLCCPRILLLTLWYPVHSKLGEVISYPVLSYIGWVCAPRLTLACIFAGFYWETDMVLAVVAFILSIGGESIEKVGVTKIFKISLGTFIMHKIIQRWKNKKNYNQHS